jgi:hypothetical protein
MMKPSRKLTAMHIKPERMSSAGKNKFANHVRQRWPGVSHWHPCQIVYPWIATVMQG